MNTRHPFRFSLELFKREGPSLGQVPVVADWEPAIEAVRLLAQRGLSLAAIAPESVVEFRPAWHPKLGEPYLSCIETVLLLPDGRQVSCQVPNAFLSKFATAASGTFVKQGLLKDEEVFEYRVTAFPASPSNGSPQKPPRITIQEVPVPLEATPASLGQFLSRSVECGVGDPQDMRVFIPQHVLTEAEALTRQSPEIEIASILIGHLHRDTETADLFLEVTAQIPARNAQGSAMKVTLGPDTYQAVQNAITLRRAGEQYLGWLHSHPTSSWCNPKCPAEARANCPFQRVFFSGDDCDVHRTLFVKAYNVALLITMTDAGLSHALFSWRNGLIVQRGFHILDPQQTEPAATPAVAATIGDNENEKPCPR